MKLARPFWLWAAGLVGVMAAAAALLRWQGRLWACACGYVLAWSGDAWGSDNSQHLSDPYTLTHVLHGFALCGLLAWAAPRLAVRWRLLAAVAAEAAWEVIENSDFVIRRYREATLALGYTGDTVINSLGDIIACGLGFLLALRLGLWRTLAAFAATEILLLVWIRDGLLLNVLMLLFPLESVKQWQMGQ
ncbi:MAG TPA: DUF2585 family protein [Pyrinomonadaceae bacterium]|nr:DUF2585 family protein [Pyrinomonadaceae bacterium]